MRETAEMLRLSAVLSSDLVNRYGSRFASGEMARALRAHWRTGLPSTISHDAHRLAGWTLPTAVSITPSATRLHGVSIIPETKEEQTALENRYQHHLSVRIDEETKPHMAALQALLKDHLRGDEKPHAAAATALVGADLARRVAPKLFETEDKDGLVDLRALEAIQPGVFRHGDLVLFAHPFLRRSLSRWNNLNAALLGALDELRDEKAATVRVRLDPDMVGLAASVTRALEFDYWYGPKFDDDLKSIPTGVTKHEANERERYFFGVSRTEFWWQSRDNQHILEAEEVRDLPTLAAGATAFGCRYVHSIVDEHTGKVFHLDGAIRSYNEEALVERLDASIAEAGRKTQYTKLWRADGDVPLSKWKRLVHDHFRDNPLVAEYLRWSPEPPVVEPPVATPTTRPSSPRATKVPYTTDATDGVNILLSLHELESAPVGDRDLRPLEKITAYGVQRDVIDADAVELRKVLLRKGLDLNIPDDALRIAFEDRYLTIPLVRHAGAEHVVGTIDALGELLGAWVTNKNDDRAVAFTLAAPISGVEVRCSAYGHVRSLGDVLQPLRTLFAAKSLDDVVAWVDSRSSATRKNAPEGFAAMERFDSMMTQSETYRVERTQIAPDDLVVSMNGNAVQHQLRLPADDSELVAAVRSGKLRPAFAWVIEKSECSRCARAYFTCPCSKVLDNDVVQKCTEAKIAYPFWTDRPA